MKHRDEKLYRLDIATFYACQLLYSSGVHKARLISTLYVHGMLHAVVRYFEVQIYIYYTRV